MTIPFIDLGTQYRKNKSDIDQAIARVLGHGQYIMGPEIGELEQKLADHIEVKHALACSSGTDALILPLMAKGLTKTDAVFTTPFTFFASAEAISLAGATPVFVDIDPNTYNIDPDALEAQIQETIKQGQLTPRGIMPVDLFGLAADYAALSKIASKYGLFLLEDAAQSFAADYHGAKAGSFGDVAATSFYPAKPLGCYGDGGAVFTNDSDLYQDMVSLRVHGQSMDGNKYDNVRIGINARMDTIQAAVLLEKLKFYDAELELRDKVAARYSRNLAGSVTTPNVPEGQSSVWAQYSIQVSNRDELRTRLQEQGIPTAVFYPIPIHLCSAYNDLGYQAGDFPVSEKIAERILSLPMHPYLSDEKIDLISSLITEHAIL